MNISVKNGEKISSELLVNYFQNLVNRFFKILPMRENNEQTLEVYMTGLQSELMGCKSFIPELCVDAKFLSLLSILQYLIENECPVSEVKRYVFEAISTCNKLQGTYLVMEV